MTVVTRIIDQMMTFFVLVFSSCPPRYIYIHTLHSDKIWKNMNIMSYIWPIMRARNNKTNVVLLVFAYENIL